MCVYQIDAWKNVHARLCVSAVWNRHTSSAFEFRTKSNYFCSLQSTVQSFCGIWQHLQMAFNWIKLCCLPSKGPNRECFRRLFSLITAQRSKYRLIFLSELALPSQKLCFVIWRNSENSLKFTRSPIRTNTTEFKVLEQFLFQFKRKL